MFEGRRSPVLAIMAGFAIIFLLLYWLVEGKAGFGEWEVELKADPKGYVLVMLLTLGTAVVLIASGITLSAARYPQY